MDKIKIVGWTNFDSDYPCKRRTDNELSELLAALKEEIFNNKYCFSGEAHQYSMTGVPVFSDGTCIRMSMRAWGYLMAGIYSDVHGINLSYMDFYMDVFKDEKQPELIKILVEPAEIDPDDYQTGIVVKEDSELISETLSMGIDLMTTDKVLKEYMELIKQGEED